MKRICSVENSKRHIKKLKAWYRARNYFEWLKNQQVKKVMQSNCQVTVNIDTLYYQIILEKNWFPKIVIK